MCEGVVCVWGGCHGGGAAAAVGAAAVGDAAAWMQIARREPHKGMQAKERQISARHIRDAQLAIRRAQHTYDGQDQAADGQKVLREQRAILVAHVWQQLVGLLEERRHGAVSVQALFC